MLELHQWLIVAAVLLSILALAFMMAVSRLNKQEVKWEETTKTYASIKRTGPDQVSILVRVTDLSGQADGRLYAMIGQDLRYATAKPRKLRFQMFSPRFVRRGYVAFEVMCHFEGRTWSVGRTVVRRRTAALAEEYLIDHASYNFWLRVTEYGEVLLRLPLDKTIRELADLARYEQYAAS